MPYKNMTTNPEAVTMEADTMDVQEPVMTADDVQALATVDHTSKKLITDQEAMERLWEGVDIAVQRAEDAIPAAGINLLRGTRDFTIGSTNENKIGGYYDNGYKEKPELVDFIRGDDGFHYARCIKPSSIQYLGTSYLLKNWLDDYITISFEIKLNDVTVELNNLNIISIYLRTKNDTNGNIGTISKNPSNLGINVTELQKDKWYRVSFNLYLPGYSGYSAFELATISLMFRDGQDYSFRKLKVENGKTANPTWLASPFDVVEKSDIGEIQSGSVSVSPITAKEYKSVDVTFPKAFANNPMVFCSVGSVKPNQRFAAPSNIKREQFTLTLYSDDAPSSLVVQWIAIAQ